ncbi:hypothetical protein pipiens_003339 [Culex pipiens pipiens]|uniref:Uncharacterized protein n=1 Tax=Culex pipiens pipiens TaxID=38569 RepID=A0ABD1CZX2_CULPP
MRCIYVETSQNHKILPVIATAAAGYVGYADGKSSTSSAGRDRYLMRELENVPKSERVCAVLRPPDKEWFRWRSWSTFWACCRCGSWRM